MYKPGLTIWYNVTSIERTLEFYTKKLDFQLQFHDTEGGMAIISTNTNDCTIGFSEVESVIPSTSSTVFDVHNLEQAVESFSGKGITFIGEIETIPNMVKLATFVDPDGHNLMLAESLV
jgi:predicted enzyme related to lactoylglutathione lyase